MKSILNRLMQWTQGTFNNPFTRYFCGLVIAYIIIDILESTVITIFKLLSLDFRVQPATQIFLTISLLNSLISFKRRAHDKLYGSNIEIEKPGSTKKNKKAAGIDIGSISSEIVFESTLRIIDWVDLKISNFWLTRVSVVSTVILVLLIWLEGSCFSPTIFQVTKQGLTTEVRDGDYYPLPLEDGISSLSIKLVEGNTNKVIEKCRNWANTSNGVVNFKPDECDASIFIQNLKSKEHIEVNARQCALPLWQIHHFYIIAP